MNEKRVEPSGGLQRQIGEIRNQAEAVLLELRIEHMRSEVEIRRLLRTRPVDPKAFGDAMGRLAAIKMQALAHICETLRRQESIAREAGVKLRYDANPAPMMIATPGFGGYYGSHGGGGGGQVCEPVGGDVIQSVCTSLSNPWYWQVNYTDGSSSSHVETLPVEPVS